MISNPIHTKSAFLIWQSPLEGGGSRRRLPVALMCANDDSTGVSFRYLRDTSDFETALSEGFQGYTGIPLDREDTSDAINTLGRRLPNSERADYVEFLNRFGLSPENNLPTLSLLAYTGAKLTSDSFSVADTFEGFDHSFQYIFDVAGRRHNFDATPSPQKGDAVSFCPEPENPHDPHAIALRDDDGNRLGYVNTCQAAAVNTWLANGSISGEVFRVNGRTSYPRLFVIAAIEPSLASKVA
ncbi:MAG: HIRAN domain-containing protein [Rhodobacteraceae bacterium]|nr:HIRAN domain-containing protein [Paracoccaceae bacterium]